MKARKVKSRFQSKDKVNILIETDVRTAEKLQKEISKAIHKVNRQTTEKVGYEMLLITRENIQ